MKSIELIGRKFGNLTVISTIRKGRYTKLLCKCDCGNETTANGADLIKGRRKSCGCSTLVVKPGQKYGRWTVIKRVSNRGHATIFLCQCKCGVTKEVIAGSLTNGHSKSCGCFSRERASRDAKIEYGLSAKKTVFNMYRINAERRNLLFDLTFDQFLILSQQRCHYCGSFPNNHHRDNGNGGFKYNGIDRKDSKKGYTLGNIVPCCNRCNKAKMRVPYEDFINWITDVYCNLKFEGLLNFK